MLISTVCPWDDKERLIEGAFRQLVRDLLAKGFNHVYVFGTCGEGYAVDTERFREVVTVFREETKGAGVFPQVGTIGLSTANIVERIAFAHQLGFREFQISLPSWGVLDNDEMRTFFRDVCGAFPDSKFLHYNLMRAKRLLNGSDYRRIADEVPNLVATKNTGDSVMRVVDLMTNAPDLQHFFGEFLFPYGCLYGECSMLSSFGGMMPTKTKQLYDADSRGRSGEALAIAGGMAQVIHDFLEPTKFRDPVDGAYDKMLARIAGVEMPLRLLSPYHCFSEDVYHKCRGIMVNKHAKWLG